MNEDSKKVLGDLFKKVKDVASEGAKDISNQAKETFKDVDWEGAANEVKDGLTKKATDASSKLKEKLDSVDWDEVGDKTKEGITTAAKKTGDAATKAATAVKDKTVEVLDANGDGVIDVNDLIILSLKVPGIRINREEFIKNELSKKYQEDVVTKAIENNLIIAGIPNEEIDKIADAAIESEQRYVMDISSTLGLAGGLVSLATIPANVIQYYGYMLRCAQKLMYLYGFPQIKINEVDSEDNGIETLTICLAVMHGVEGADLSVKAMGLTLGTNIDGSIKQGVVEKVNYKTVVKKVAKKFKKKMNKKYFINIIKDASSMVGGLVGDALAQNFKPCCEKLKNALKDTPIFNKDYKTTEEENKYFETIASEEEIPA